MLARPKARNALAAALQVSLNLPPKSKLAPAPEPEPAPTPEPEVEPESPRKLEIDAANAALRSVLVEMHQRTEVTRECSQCLDDVIDCVIADEERRVVQEARSDAERIFAINRLMHDMVELVETRAADLVAEQCAVASHLAAVMTTQVVAEEMQRCAQYLITVHTPTVVRLNPHAPEFYPRGFYGLS